MPSRARTTRRWPTGIGHWPIVGGKQSSPWSVRKRTVKRGGPLPNDLPPWAGSSSIISSRRLIVRHAPAKQPPHCVAIEEPGSLGSKAISLADCRLLLEPRTSPSAPRSTRRRTSGRCDLVRSRCPLPSGPARHLDDAPRPDPVVLRFTFDARKPPLKSIT
jgi:hypothetical protein